MKTMLAVLFLFALSNSEAADCACTCPCVGPNTPIDGPITPPVITPPVSHGDPGSGLWYPSGTQNRVVADQSSDSMGASYVPGCLNGQFAKDSSSGCAVYDSHLGVSMGRGKQILLRYKTPASITNGKTIKVTGWNGGSVSVNMRVWLSSDPRATYASVPNSCKTASSVTPAISTGSAETVTTVKKVWGKTTTTTATYCKLNPNTVYYFGMEFDEAVSDENARFQVDESNFY